MKNRPFTVERRGLWVGDATKTTVQTRLRVLGTFSLELVHVTAPSLATQKARALLAYLVAHRDCDVARERLLEMFWPNVELDSGRDSLRSALWAIRRSIRDAGFDPDGFLAASRTVVRWKADSWLDSQAFEELARSDAVFDLDAALDLYRGDFLEGDFEEWTVAERSRLERVYDSVLERLVRLHRRHEAAQMLLSRNPYDEASYALLIEQELQAGRFVAAGALAAQCERALSDLATAPSGDLKRLIASISPRRLQSVSRFVLPFAGRDNELSAIRQCLTGASSTSVLLVCGEAGIGKTALLARGRDISTSLGLNTYDLRCFDADVRDFGPFQEIHTGQDRVASVEAFVDGLLKRVQKRSAIILDDAHALSGNALAVMSELVKRSSTCDLALLIASRIEGLQTVESAVNARPHDTIFLGPLPYADLRSAIDAAVRAEEGALADAVYERSGGHPFFASSLLDSLAQSGVLQADTGFWRVAAPLTSRIPLPKTLSNYIGSRLLAAGKDASVVASAIALEPAASAEDLACVLQMSEEDVLNAIDNLSLLGVIAPPTSDAALFFAHDLYREVAANTINAGRRNRLHRAFAQRFAEHAAPEVSTRRARHLAAAGDTITAADAYYHAACQALHARSPIEALRRCSDGLTELQRLESVPDVQRCAARLNAVAAQASAAIGESRAALTSASQAISIARQLNDAETFVRAALVRDGMLLELHDFAAVLAGAQVLIAMLRSSDDRAALAAALSNVACARRFSGDEIAAVQAAADAERAADDCGSDDLTCDALAQGILTAVTWWRFREAAEAAERIKLRLKNAGPAARITVHCVLASLHLALEQHSEASSALTVAGSMSSAFRDSKLESAVQCANARLALAVCEPNPALRAAALLHDMESPRARALAFAFRAEALFLGGRDDTSRDDAFHDTAEDFVQDVDSGSRSIHLARTLIAALTGASDAREKVCKSLDLLEEAAHQTPLEADTAFARLAQAARMCGAEHVARRAELRSRAYGAVRKLAISRIASAVDAFPKNA